MQQQYKSTNSTICIGKPFHFPYYVILDGSFLLWSDYKTFNYISFQKEKKMEKELFSLNSIRKWKFFPLKKNFYDFSEIVELPILWAKNGKPKN